MGYNDDYGFEDFSYRKTCPKCKKRFEVTEIEQVPGFRWKEDLKCPYCGEVLCTSMEYEYITRKV